MSMSGGKSRARARIRTQLQSGFTIRGSKFFTIPYVLHAEPDNEAQPSGYSSSFCYDVSVRRN